MPALLPAWVAAQPTVVTTEHVRAELLAHAPEGVGPGKPLWLGLSIDHQPKWHTYWKNPGDSGLATTFAWTLPAGVKAGPIEWPVPQPLPFGPLMNHGYDGQVLLPVALTLPPGAGDVEVALRADWLVCKDVCIPESGEFRMRLPAGAVIDGQAKRFAEARAQAPVEPAGATGSARVDGEVLAVAVDGLPAEAHGKSLRFFPELGGVVDPAAPMEQRWDGARWVARVPLSPQRSESPENLAVVLADSTRPGGWRVGVPVTGPWPGPGAPAEPAFVAPPVVPVPASAPATSLLASMGLALLGGLLLNLMPCVFPILSLKVLGFAQAGQDRRTLAAQGFAYTAGVVVSFLALAGLLLALRAGGEALGWGFQLQSPLFVAGLAVVFTLIGLNLAGVFEFGSVLPGGLAAMRLHHPLADQALTGVLAVAVASPCTAPFMGVALGAALTLPTLEALAVFSALGVGMALPYLAASLVPAVARALPRPGAWMARFKVAMAFPMFATVVWLVWVLGQQAGIDGATGLLAVLVAVAFVMWALGSPGIGARGRVVLGAVAVPVLVVAVLWAWPGLDDARAPRAAVPEVSADWQPWRPEAVAAALAEGRPVFVDFTAAWCVTCQFNKRTALADPAVLAQARDGDVLLLRADWTRRDPVITRELTRLGRSGVPVYALYARPDQPPRLLPEVLRAADVREALAGVPTTRDGGSTSRSPS
ncbi:MAG: thioredoxin family protein [Rhizobacter sp.]